jgi:hypothetical protein
LVVVVTDEDDEAKPLPESSPSLPSKEGNPDDMDMFDLWRWQTDGASEDPRDPSLAARPGGAVPLDASMSFLCPRPRTSFPP